MAEEATGILTSPPSADVFLIDVGTIVQQGCYIYHGSRDETGQREYSERATGYTLPEGRRLALRTSWQPN